MCQALGLAFSECSNFLLPTSDLLEALLALYSRDHLHQLTVTSCPTCRADTTAAGFCATEHGGVVSIWCYHLESNITSSLDRGLLLNDV